MFTLLSVNLFDLFNWVELQCSDESVEVQFPNRSTSRRVNVGPCAQHLDIKCSPAGSRIRHLWAVQPRQLICHSDSTAVLFQAHGLNFMQVHRTASRAIASKFVHIDGRPSQVRSANLGSR